MGISRDSMHKRRATGGKKKAWRKKRNMPKKKTPSKAKGDQTAKQEKLANPLKHKSDEIDEIFASRKRKNPEADESQKPQENVNGMPNKEKDKNKKKKRVSEGSRRRTNDGLKIYQVDELGINKPGSGFTPLCPFDCSCCF